MPRLVYTLKDLDQSTAPRHLRQGALTASQNTRSTKTGPRRKRRGFARQAVSTYSFAIAADDTDYSPSATMAELSPDGAMFRDDDDNIWARDSAGTTAYFRGHHKRCGVSVRNLGFAAHKTIKPMSLAVGTQVWHFALSTTETGATPSADPTYNCWWVTVEDSAGNVVRGPTKYTDSTGASVMNYVAVYHPVQGKVYVFSVHRSTVIRVFAISTADGSVSVAQTAFETVASAKWNCVDAVYTTSAAKVAVVTSSWNQATANVVRVRHSFLNTATNAPSASVDAQLNDPGTTGAYLAGGVSYLQGQPWADGSLRYVYWVKSASNQDDVLVVQVVHNDSTLAVTDSRTIYTTQSVEYLVEHAGVCTGFYKQSTDESFIFAHLQRFEQVNDEVTRPTAPTNAFNMTTSRIVHNNTSHATTTQSDIIAGWLASKPFQGANSAWYVLTGLDSGSNGVQRAFHVRRADIGTSRTAPDACRIVAQIFWPDASFQAHRWRGQLQASLPLNITNAWGWAPTQAAISNGAKLALGRTGETPQTHDISVVTIDFAAKFSRGTRIYDDMILYPGGVPCVAGPRAPAHDLTPLILPLRAPRVTSAGSSTALSTVLMTASFRFRDPSGRLTRSTSFPTPASLSFNSAGTRTVAVRACQHVGLGEVEIEIWASTPGGPTLHLQTVIPNDQTAQEISVNVDPAKFRDDTEDLPFGADNAPVPTPPPPCRVAAGLHADRIFLSGTPTEGEFLFSQPVEGGFGPEFNIEALVQTWLGKGPINAICPIDFNSLGFWREKQIAAVQGPGPSGLGGGYGTMLEISTEKGVLGSASRGHLVFRTPLGAVFQDAASGRLCIVQPGLRAEELPPGMEDTAQASLLVAGGLVESEGTVWFQLASGAMAVLDLRHPDEGRASQWGNWHLWTSSALTAAASVGMVDAASGPLWLQADGSWRTYKTAGQLFQDTNAASAQVDVLMSLTTGKMAPDGLFGEVLVSDVAIMGTYVSASSVRVTTTNGAGTPENHDVTIASPFDYGWRPGNLLREKEFTLTLAEQAGSTGEGFELDAVGVEFAPAGQMARAPTTRII